MDKGADTFLDYLANSDSIQLILSGLLGLGVFAGILIFLNSLFPDKDRVRTRLGSLGLSDAHGIKNREDESHPKALDFVSRVAYKFLPKSQQERRFTFNRLRYAGYRSLTALSTYFFVRLLGMFILPLGVLLIPFFDTALGWREIIPYALGAFAAGMVIPSYILDRRVSKRQRIIRNGLPDVIDMLVITTEAGLGLNSALVRVAAEIKGIHPELADEMDMVNAELQGGIDRDRALRNFYERTGVDEVKSLVVLINQSLKFGTSVAQSLRIYSEEYRQKRMQKAQEEAAMLGTKMIFPLAFCFMPSFFIVAVGPAMLKAIKVFAGH